MEGEIKNLSQVILSVIFSLCYSYFFISKLKQGFLRFIFLLPVFFLFTILPLFLSSRFLRAVTAFFITWLANFKLLLFAFSDQGPLSSIQSKSLSIFIISASLPIRMKQNVNQNPSSDEPIKKKKKLPLNLGTEILASSILIGLTSNYREILHPKIVLVLYCCMVFLLVEILVALSSFIVRSLVGLELDPPSDEPYLSTSLQEFWGKRWNLTVTNTLRQTVYKPVRSICTIPLGKELAPLPAILAAFLVSGLMHELLFYYVTGANPTWEMTVFFVLHGVCVVLEFGLKRAILLMGWKNFDLGWFVLGPLTIGFVVITSFWLFFPPLVRNGADAMVLEEFKIFGELVNNQLMRFFSPILVRLNLS